MLDKTIRVERNQIKDEETIKFFYCFILLGEENRYNGLSEVVIDQE